MKASDLIRDAYQEIGKGAAEQAISPDMTQTAIRYLNNLMYAKDYMGLGYTEVTAGSDEITTPAYSWLWMVKALAVKLCPQFGIQENYAQLKADEKEAWSTVLISLSRISPPTFAGTVPKGSGNRKRGYYESPYYSESDNGLLTETNQDIVVEDATT